MAWTSDSGWPARSVIVSATIRKAAARTDGWRTTRRVARRMNGRSTHEDPTAQRMKKEMALAYIQAAAAKSETLWRQPSSRASRYAPSAATKNAIAAENVRPCAIGSRHASSVNGEYAAGCADAASTSPESMNGFHSGHSRWRNANCTALRHGIICAYRSEMIPFCGG